ncbi:cob(I)yrinic acid a,c-diamide adenosyltransferase [Patescibacteria group bacterium]|nr:cob(I)yrinic acid a,c-diamide adenosyltransferase [Patescibacteria group bacterium]
MKTVFYTGRGDGGESLFGNKKLPKSDPLFDLLGNLDELNALIGVCLTDPSGSDAVLKRIQEIIFIAAAEAAAAGFGYEIKPVNKMSAAHTEFLEKEIQTLDEKLPALKNFVLPGGTRLAAELNLARAVCRRTERSAVLYNSKKPLSPELLKFLNRLSSLLFALAREANRAAGRTEEHPNYE